DLRREGAAVRRPALRTFRRRARRARDLGRGRAGEHPRADPAIESLLPYRISGTYLESCNCDAICPCRMVGGVPGGRSPHGVCLAVLSWLVAEGHAGGVARAGLGAVIETREDDEEAGSARRVLLRLSGRVDV